MPKNFPFRGIRGRLFLFLLIVLVPIILIETLIYYKRFETRKSEELQANLEVARALAKNFETFILDIVHSQLVIGLALTPSQPVSVEDQNRILYGFQADNPGVRSVFWLNPRGLIVASSLRTYIGFDVSDRSFYREIMTGRDWSVSELIVGKATGKLGFTVSRGIRNEQGKLLGVVAAAVEPDLLDSVLGIDRSKEGGVSLVDNKGMLVYRYPRTEYTWEQRNWLKFYPMIDDSLKGKEVITSVLSESTGKKRLAAFTPVSSIGWVAAAGRAEDEVTKSVTSTLFFQAGLVLVVALAGFCAAVALAQPITGSIIRLRNHALTLGRGEKENFAIASGPGELKDLAVAFNKMAGEVRSREAALRESEQRWVTTLVSIGDAVIATDLSGKITFMNKVAEELTGWTLSEALTKPVADVFHIINEHTRNRIEDPVAKVLREGVTVGLANHTVLVGKNGKAIPIDDSGAPIRDQDGKAMGVVLVFRDITERKHAEEALQKRTLELQHLTETLEERVKERTRELAALSSELLVAQEKERKRISYDLHDNIWQTLEIIRTQLEHLFSREDEADWPSFHQKAKQLIPVIRDTIARVRSMQGDLWPSVLDDIGIVATIDWYCREFGLNHTGLGFEKDVGLVEDEVPASAKIVIYRVMQEALSNVANHSQASHVSLSLMKSDHRVELLIKDNGVGFDPEEAIVKRSPWGGLGLLSLKERTELSGGLFGVESAKGKGTTVRASWPLSGNN